VRFTREAAQWYTTLTAEDTVRIKASIDELALRGPALGRPYVDSIKGSRHRNMKELRSMGGNLRALFAFDRQRRAIVLVGGDKTNNARSWYRQQIPIADRLFGQHNRGDEGCGPIGSRPGGRSR
jgi:hypothetical protein